jgi:hypothetical protein
MANRVHLLHHGRRCRRAIAESSPSARRTHSRMTPPRYAHRLVLALWPVIRNDPSLAKNAINLGGRTRPPDRWPRN